MTGERRRLPLAPEVKGNRIRAMAEARTMKTKAQKRDTCRSSRIPDREKPRALAGPSATSMLEHSVTPLLRSRQPCFSFEPCKVEAAGVGFHLANTDGFWELALKSEQAVLPQSQALFYLACLVLEDRDGSIRAADLAFRAFERFGEHPDFDLSVPWQREVPDAQLLEAALERRQQALRAILDNAHEPEPVQREAAGEIVGLAERMQELQDRTAVAAEAVGRAVLESFQRLHAALGTARDARGNPHPVLRWFGRHLLLYVIMPSVRRAAQTGATCFVYEPPEGTSRKGR